MRPILTKTEEFGDQPLIPATPDPLLCNLEDSYSNSPTLKMDSRLRGNDREASYGSWLLLIIQSLLSPRG